MSQTLKKDPRFVLLNGSLNFFHAKFISLCERFYHSIHLWMVMTNCQQNWTHPVMYGKKSFFTHSLFEKYFSNINSSNSSWLSPSSSTFYKKKRQHLGLIIWLKFIEMWWSNLNLIWLVHLDVNAWVWMKIHLWRCIT